MLSSTSNFSNTFFILYDVSNFQELVLFSFFVASGFHGCYVFPYLSNNREYFSCFLYCFLVPVFFRLQQNLSFKSLVLHCYLFIFEQSSKKLIGHSVCMCTHAHVGQLWGVPFTVKVHYKVLGRNCCFIYTNFQSYCFQSHYSPWTQNRFPRYQFYLDGVSYDFREVWTVAEHIMYNGSADCSLYQSSTVSNRLLKSLMA